MQSKDEEASGIRRRCKGLWGYYQMPSLENGILVSQKECNRVSEVQRDKAPRDMRCLISKALNNGG